MIYDDARQYRTPGFTVWPWSLGLPDTPPPEGSPDGRFLYLAEAIDQLTAGEEGAWADYRAVRTYIARRWRRSLKGTGAHPHVKAGLVERVQVPIPQRATRRERQQPNTVLLRLTADGRAEHFAHRGELAP